MKESKAEGVFFLRLKGKGTVGKREKKPGFWEVQVKSVMLSAAVIALELGVTALLIAGAIIPEVWMDGCVLIAALTGVMSGVLMTKMSGREGGAVYGMAYGAVLVALCTVTGVLLYGKVDWTWCGIMGTICVAGGSIAGAAGGRSRKKRY